MLNRETMKVLLNRLPLALVSLPEDVVNFLEYKWGGYDGMPHSVKSTLKQFKRFKDVEITDFENQALSVIDTTLTSIYTCQKCGTDLRKCGVLRNSDGIEQVELYISEDGKQARTHHERFIPKGAISYACMQCRVMVHPDNPVFSFLRNGIRKDICIEYLHRYHTVAMEKLKTKDTKDYDQQSDVPPRPSDEVPTNAIFPAFMAFPDGSIADVVVSERERLDSIRRRGPEEMEEVLG